LIQPALTRITSGDVHAHVDVDLRDRFGLLVAFSERGGGVSSAPFCSLNLASHVGDDPDAVDENRSRLLRALGMAEFRDSLTTAEQVHGVGIHEVTAGEAGAGAYATTGPTSLPATDALVTSRSGVPVALHFADCVPVVLVAPAKRWVGVAHAGWRGALDGLPRRAASDLASRSGCEPGELLAYIGPHICVRHYPVSNELLTTFAERFDTVRTAEPGHLDLGAIVLEGLLSAGVAADNICQMGTCTVEAGDRFFSYRAESGRTGRHAALAAILP